MCEHDFPSSTKTTISFPIYAWKDATVKFSNDWCRFSPIGFQWNILGSCGSVSLKHARIGGR